MQERIRRSIAEVLRDAWWRERGTPPDLQGVNPTGLAARIAAAERHNYTIVPATRRRPPSPQLVSRPSTTALIGRLLKSDKLGCVAYQTLSGVVHGEPVAIAHRLRLEIDDGKRRASAKPELPQQEAAMLAHLAMEAVAWAFSAQVALFGWDTSEWRKAIEECFLVVDREMASSAEARRLRDD